MKTSDKLRIFGVRLGNIFFGISLLCTIVAIFSALTPLTMALYILLLIVVVLITLGTVFVIVDNFGEFFSDSTTFMANFTEGALAALPYVTAAGVISGVLAAFLLFLEVRAKKHTAKAVAAIVFAVLTVIFYLFSGALTK